MKNSTLIPTSFFESKIVIASLLLICGNVSGQVFIGISGDLGNRVHYSDAASLFKRPPAPSASLMIRVNERCRNNFLVQYDFALGVLGYIVKPAEVDSLTAHQGVYFADWNYNNLYVNASLSGGKQFQIDHKKVSVFIGGGVAYFLDTFGDGVVSTSYVWGTRSFEKVFEYETHLTKPNIKGFVQLSAQTAISRSFAVGLRFIYQFNAAIAGTYSFYHMNDPPTGNLEVAQRTLSVLFLYNIKSRKRLP